MKEIKKYNPSEKKEIEMKDKTEIKNEEIPSIPITKTESSNVIQLNKEENKEKREEKKVEEEFKEENNEENEDEEKKFKEIVKTIMNNPNNVIIGKEFSDLMESVIFNLKDTFHRLQETSEFKILQKSINLKKKIIPKEFSSGI